MRLIMPLPGSETTTGVTAPNVMGLKANEAPRAVVAAPPSNHPSTPAPRSDGCKSTKDGPNGVEDKRP